MAFNPTKRKQDKEKSKREEELESQLLITKLSAKSWEAYGKRLEKELSHLKEKYPEIVRTAFVIALIVGLIFGIFIGGKVF